MYGFIGFGFQKGDSCVGSSFDIRALSIIVIKKEK